LRVADIIGRVDDPYAVLKPPKGFNGITLVGKEI
jgi:rRNA processing protein Gar1